ncbi:AtpZ/AtpI family protein [Limnochorda pilosa]|uniref:AtpZ/AtpI family protein n=1 Tax=Limnochorda pilosa TaxID=1555112 RepID=A0A0K2SP62_LIMPI|nr:AtpZ/AtpI family protein [Limnochorda pilosa]BAS28923.1 hypothetical protein LIP_3094 [Limnochorda pilosa]
MNRGLADWTRYGGVGLSWVFLTGALLYAGYRGGRWLDARWGTEPVFLVAGLVGAMVLSLVALFQEVRAVTTAMGQRDRSPDGKEEEPSSPRPRKPPPRK